MSVCVEVSEPKSCPLFPAVLTGRAGDSGSDISCLASAPVSCGPGLPGPALLHRDINPAHCTLHAVQLHHYNDNHGLSLLGMDMVCCVAMDGVSPGSGCVSGAGDGGPGCRGRHSGGGG